MFETPNRYPFWLNMASNALCKDSHVDLGRRFIDDELGATVPIPSNSSRAGELQIDEELYKARHLVESFFLVIKRFRRIALRYEKTASSCSAL